MFLDPHETIWIDLIVPRGDPLWDDDVNRSFHWLGNVWARALGLLGVDAEVHTGPLERTPWSDLVCFAGLGPGEVTVTDADGRRRKVVGLSQRRTRAGARFQSLVYVGIHDTAAEVVDYLAEPRAPDERQSLRQHLIDSVFTIPAMSTEVTSAFVRSLPD